MAPGKGRSDWPFQAAPRQLHGAEIPKLADFPSFLHTFLQTLHVDGLTFGFGRVATMVDIPKLTSVVDYFLVQEVRGPQYRASLLAGPEQSLGNFSASVSHLIALRVPPRMILPVFEWSVLAQSVPPPGYNRPVSLATVVFKTLQLVLLNPVCTTGTHWNSSAQHLAPVCRSTRTMRLLAAHPGRAGVKT
jgi:hypothetical protein